jgi:hypothetical protein
MFLPPTGDWSRATIVAFRIIPIILMIILMSPTLISWPMLGAEKRADFCKLVRIFVNWATK